MEKENLNEEKKRSVINDAVHGVIYFPDTYKTLIKTIVDDPLFQRLRHIKQLGMSELIFPTAVHNRFSHSIGTAYVAFRMAERLCLKDEEKKLAIVGTLLHDIGHGPFSHAFEKLLKRKKDEIKHEDWTRSFLKEFEEKLENHNINYEKISKFIMKKKDNDEEEKQNKENRDNIIVNIITSQLDADRLDYLLRDSHFCGVPYGRVDLDWIINQLVIIQEANLSPRLGIYEKGWRAVEHFLLCRRMMIQNIYNHPKIKALESLFILFLEELCKATGKDKDKVEKLITNSKLKKFLFNVKSFKEDEKIDKHEFIQNNYPYYSSLTDHNIWELIKNCQQDDENSALYRRLASKIYKRDIPKSYPIKKGQKEVVNSIISELKNPTIDEGQLFTTENVSLPYNIEDDKIRVKTKGSYAKNITEYSTLLTGQPEEEYFLAIYENELNSNKIKHIKKELKDYVSFDDEDI